MRPSTSSSNLSLFQKVVENAKRSNSLTRLFSKTNKREITRPIDDCVSLNLEYPYRYTPFSKLSNPVQLLMDFIHDEEKYIIELNETILKLQKIQTLDYCLNNVELIELFENLITAIQRIKQIFENKMRIKSEFQYPDGIITERYNEIQSVYEEYMYTYEKFREGVDEYVSLNFKFEIEITNLFKNVTRPFQRLLDYRYFLRTCLICIRKSKVSFTHHLQMLEYLNLTVIEKLTLFINQFHKADKFLELAKWEDNVLTQDCKISGFGNISPDTVSIGLDLHLTVPYITNSSDPISTNPELLYDADFSVLAVVNGGNFNSKSKWTNMKFNVFSDTLVITEGDPRIMKTKLMFPPIPIEHLSITMTDVAGTLNREHINYEILISPFVKLLLKSEEHNQKETAYLMKNLELMIQQLPFKDTKKTSKLQYFFTNKPERHRKKTNLSLNFISPSDENQMDVDSFMKVNTSLDKNIYYSLTDNYILKKNELNYTDVKNLFNSDCIMYQFKHQNQNFEKCIANQISIHSKGHQSWVKLILSQTGHEMVTFRIDGTIKYRSSTRANADGKTLEMVFHQNNVQKTQIFALKFPNEQVYNEITMVLGKCVTMSISANYIEFKDHLILQPKPNWNHFDIDINQSSLNTLDYLQTKEVTFHRMCLLKPMNSKNYVQLGPVDSYLVLSGPPGQIFSTRLVLRSTINPTLTYLNVELFPNDWFIKEQPDNIVMLRIFDRFLKTFTDYYLTMNDNLMYQEKFIEILEKESKECLKRQELQTQKKFLRNESEETKVLQLGDDEVHLNSIEAQISKLGLRPHHKKAGQSSSSLEKRKVSASFDKTFCQVKHLKLSRVNVDETRKLFEQFSQALDVHHTLLDKISNVNKANRIRQ